ncbi:MAG TPA: Rho termination factor N-terminal domain-containing protein [Solirubrobacterales bacterium]|jgi:transcription termination factor Rho|nr:Rho termination factor N-terminal domain-containing protein [Solirubrobacterales bacterium]
MTKAELENKHLGELHSLAAKAGVERYRMLSKAELIAKLADGDSGSGRQSSGGRQPSAASGGGEQRERPPRRRRSGSRSESGNEGRAPRSGRAPRAPREAESTPDPAAEAPASPAATPPPRSEPSDSSARPKRRRRRRFGRRGKQEGVTLQGLLLPPESGRQALLCAETRAGCTALLRGIAADLSAETGGPDPVVLLIDPSPEELADWRRDAPKAEIVAAGQPRHASDALAQASARAAAGDAVILLVDSLTRLAEAYEDAEAAKQFFDAGRNQASSGSGSLTVVAALERPAAS